MGKAKRRRRRAKRRGRRFTSVLIQDVAAANKRVEDADSPTHRRELVRSVFAAIEGLNWDLKRGLYGRGFNERLSVHEMGALTEQSYIVDEKGEVRATPRFLPLATNIRFVLAIIQRYRTNYKVDYSHIGWSNLKASIRIRDRLVHPKKLADLNVTEAELRQTMSAFTWFLRLVVESHQP
jgi:hypothetical protein